MCVCENGPCEHKSELCLWQGRDILEKFGELPSRNVSVRVVTSIPSVPTNSTDLEILKQKGVEELLLTSTFSAGYTLICTALLLFFCCHPSGS